jgi:hypothetical protein
LHSIRKLLLGVASFGPNCDYGFRKWTSLSIRRTSWFITG